MRYENYVKITEYPEKEIEALLRSYVQFLPNANFIFAGSRHISSSLKKLLDNELVYKTSDGYIVYDRFMGEWLRQLDF